MKLSPGARFGSYEVIAEIGAGGMGEVYRARDGKLARDVAVKVLPALFTDDAERLARFRREAQVLAALNHPNIAQIYGLEDGDGAPALVMELVEGEDLAQRLAAGPLALEEAAAIARQIAEALEAAHEQGFIHRDLKPANVKLRPDGAVKVLDFGLAKALDPLSSLSGASATMSPTLTGRATQMGTIIGTAAYMAPEQAKGRAVDRRADVWAFGAVLYEMLSGQRAFQGEDISDTLASVLRQEVDLSALPGAVPASLRRLIGRCLTRDPRQRLRDIGEARVLLERLQAGSDDEAEPTRPEPAVVASRPVWRRVARALALTLTAAAISGYAGWMLRPLTPRPVGRFAIELGEDRRFTNPGRKSVAVSPDGSSLAYVADRRIYVRSLDTLEAHAVPGSDGGSRGIHCVTFSPDGQWLAFRPNNGGSLKRLPVAGGAPVTICPAESLYGLSWSAQGILFGQLGRGILRVSPDGGVPEVVAAAGPDEVLDAPQLLPGGKTLLFSVKKMADGWDKGQVVAQTLGDGGRKTLVAAAADATYVPTGHLVYAVAGVLFAVPFDVDTLSVTGGPVPVVEGVYRASATAAAHYACSTTGTLVYLPGPASGEASDELSLALFDRKNPPEPLKLPAGPYGAPRVSPDGKWVAFERGDGEKADVWVYELDGNTAMRRLTFGGRNLAPVWSADSRWIAFQSDREGDPAIFRQRSDGSGTAERMTKPEKGAAHIPQSWSPDGRRLLFTVQKDGQHTLWELTIEDRKTAQFTESPSADLAEAAFSPDGKWVAYTVRDSSESRLSTYVVPYPPTGARYQVPIPGGHAMWARAGGQLSMNVAPITTAVVAVRTAPQFGFGPPETYTRMPRQEPNPAATRRNADNTPDGRILGVLRQSDSQSPTVATPQLTVVLNWFEDLRRRVR